MTKALELTELTFENEDPGVKFLKVAKIVLECRIWSLGNNTLLLAEVKQIGTVKVVCFNAVVGAIWLSREIALRKLGETTTMSSVPSRGEI
jgi:hypothetical protein